MKNKKWIVLVLIIIIIFGAGAFIYTQRGNKSVDYETTNVEKGDVSVLVSGSGKVKTKDKNSIYVEVPQTIEKIHVKEGDRVSKGDILITYDISKDKEEISRDLEQANLNLANAKLNLQTIVTPASGNELLQYEEAVLTSNKNIEDAQGDISTLDIKINTQEKKIEDLKETMERNETLFNESAISKKEYEDSRLNYDLAEESLKDLVLQKELKENTLGIREEEKRYSEEKLENSKNKLLDKTNAIKYNMQKNNISLNEISINILNEDLVKLIDVSIAPCDGIVSEINISEGGIASKNVDLINISDTSNIIVEFEVSEYDAPQVELNQRVELSTSGIPDKVYNGKVVKIWEEAKDKDDSSDDEVIVPVEIEISDLDDKIKVGYTLDCDIYIEESKDVLYVPLQSIIIEEGKEYVYILSEETPVKTEIKTGLRGDKGIEVLEGVNEGDTIIFNPWDVVENGD